jgi:hypothetical protein
MPAATAEPKQLRDLQIELKVKQRRKRHAQDMRLKSENGPSAELQKFVTRAG